MGFVALIQNTATISLAAVFIALLGDRLNPARAAGQMFIGLVLGAAGLLSMAYPAIVTEGLYFDGRIVVVALSGPLGGPLSAAVTAAMVGGMRLTQGGPGAPAGLAGIALAAAGGAMLKYYFSRGAKPQPLLQLAMVGVLAASIPILSLSLLGDFKLVLSMLRGPSPVTSVTNFVGTMFCGLIVLWDRERRALAHNLNIAYGAARAASAAKSNFIGHLSHEFRSPLSAIISGLVLIQRQRHGPLGDPRYLQYAEMAEQSALHLASLVEDVLDMNVIESGDIVLRKEMVELPALIGGVVGMMASRALSAGVLLKAEEIPALRLLVDARRIRQVLINLVTNAIRFTPSGGSVRVSASATSEGCRIVVRDTGIGISAEDQARLFRPYGQVENSINAKGGGTGLGLALSKRLVELHSGVLSIESEVGRGTSILVDLPAEATSLPGQDGADPGMATAEVPA